jgi:lipopolysaccharide export system permease protein
MQNLAFYFFDPSFRLIKRVDGTKATWEGDAYRIEDGVVYQLNKQGDYDFEKFSEYRLKIPETPETFVRAEKDSEEMSYWQLRRYAERVRAEGYDNTRYLVDMNIRTSFPLITLILAFMGIPISLSLKKGGTPLAVSIGMGVCFIYLLALGYSRSLGLSGVLPPVLSAWIANLIFLFAGIYMMMHVKT